MGGGFNPIIMATHDRSIWLEETLIAIARSLAGLSEASVVGLQFRCIAVLQDMLHLLFHDLLQGTDVVWDWIDFKCL